MTYSHESILLNSRKVSIRDIVARAVTGQTPFEYSTLDFIREWLSGKEKFTIHTSGSTGAPKPITIERRAMRQSANRTLVALRLKENYSALVCLNTEYVAGKMMLVRALEGNLKIVAVEPSSNPLTDVSLKEPVDFAAVVPLQLEAILSSNETKNLLNRMKAVIVGGAEVSMKVINQLQKAETPVYATYGMTETISHIALQLLNTPNQSDYFSALPGISITQDDRGCLVINDEILSEHVVTNDLVEITGHGTFVWLGRADTVINSGGVKVLPEKVEQLIGGILNRMSLQNQFFITGFPHETLGQQIVLVLEGDPLAEQNERELWKRIRDEVPGYEQPKQLRYVHGFERTSTGKINRQKTVASISKD